MLEGRSSEDLHRCEMPEAECVFSTLFEVKFSTVFDVENWRHSPNQTESLEFSLA
jgi:hypothetical protein